MVAGPLAAVLVTAGLCGCGTGPFGEDCLPEPLTVQPAEVAIGAELVVSAERFACDAHYDEGEQYSLEMAFVSRADPIDLADVDVERDGSFTSTVTVPPAASPGESYVTVHGSPYDEPCDDGASCAGYSVRFVVLPAS